MQGDAGWMQGDAGGCRGMQGDAGGCRGMSEVHMISGFVTQGDDVERQMVEAHARQLQDMKRKLEEAHAQQHQDMKRKLEEAHAQQLQDMKRQMTERDVQLRWKLVEQEGKSGEEVYRLRMQLQTLRATNEEYSECIERNRIELEKQKDKADRELVMIHDFVKEKEQKRLEEIEKKMEEERQAEIAALEAKHKKEMDVQAKETASKQAALIKEACMEERKKVEEELRKVGNLGDAGGDAGGMQGGMQGGCRGGCRGMQGGCWVMQRGSRRDAG